MERAKTSQQEHHLQPKLKIPSQEEIDWAKDVYQKYMNDLEIAESDYRLQVFEKLHGETKDPVTKREIKKPSNKVFTLLAFAKQKEKKISPDSRLLQPSRPQTSLSTKHVLTRSLSLKSKGLLHEPGFVPPTSKLNNLSGVVPIQLKVAPRSGTEMRSRVVMKRTIDVGAQHWHKDYIKDKKIKEMREALTEANKFDELDYIEYKNKSKEEKRIEEKSRLSALKSVSYTPENN